MTPDTKRGLVEGIASQVQRAIECTNLAIALDHLDRAKRMLKELEDITWRESYVSGTGKAQ